jgi:hypothetical protein
MHIVEDGTLKPQEEIFQSVPDTQLSLFDDTTNFSRKKYRA